VAVDKQTISNNDPPEPVPLVLWLRPFDLADGYPEYAFQEALTLALENVAVAVTLKDVCTWDSEPVELGEFTKSTTVVLWLIHVGLVVSVWHRFSWNEEFGAVFRLLTFASAILWTWKIIRPKRKVFSTVDSLTTAKTYLSAPRNVNAGVFVLKCPDANWREIIRECLLRSRAVILDLTESSSHLRWEFHECVKTLGTKRIILAYRSDDRSYPTVVPGRLLKMIAPFNCRDFRLFFYPWHNNDWPDTHLLVTELRCFITDCIEERHVTLRMRRCAFCAHVIEQHRRQMEVYCSRCGASIQPDDEGRSAVS
jgi:hypothetical protein